MRDKLLTLALALSALFHIEGVASERLDEVPMYGQPAISRSEVLKRADDEFIQKAVAGLGSREAASQAWSQEADRLLQQRKFDLAVRRYNQSWLLNPKNYQPFWGFGRVALEQGRFEEAAVHLGTALELIQESSQRVALQVDLATVHSVRAQSVQTQDAAEAKRLFQLANHLYGEALSVDPSYGNGWRRWAMSLYEEGSYANAWEKVRMARKAGARPFPPPFLQALEKALPEPSAQ